METLDAMLANIFGLLFPYQYRATQKKSSHTSGWMRAGVESELKPVSSLNKATHDIYHLILGYIDSIYE